MVAPPSRPWRRTDPRKLVGAFVDDAPGMLRSSNAITRLRQTNPDAADLIELMREKVGRNCPHHGRLEDPIITILNGEVAFGCPDCSSEAVRQAWADEPPIDS